VLLVWTDEEAKRETLVEEIDVIADEGEKKRAKVMAGKSCQTLVECSSGWKPIFLSNF
jgi:hypothetical protein